MTTADDPDRPDLAAMVVGLGRALIAVERPVLRAHDMSMWGYIVLSALGSGPARTQAALAQSIGADKTRLIGVLDELQRRRLIIRRPDPTDRRAHLVSLTAAGREVCAAIRADLRVQEERVLADLPDPDRRGLLNALGVLTQRPPRPTAP
jgi:DNA-binding MarR family transcriptional regulator